MARRRWLGLGLAVALAGAAACAQVRPLHDSTTVCPEHRDLTCLTGTQCTLDAARGCQVCQCQPAAASMRPTPAPDQRDAVPVVPDILPPEAVPQPPHR